MTVETTLAEVKIGFVGAGAMATAIIAGLRQQNLIPAAHIIASDPVATKRETLTEQYGINTTPDNLTAITGQDIVVLAIKPQMLPQAATELVDKIPSDALLISILAGTRVDTLRRVLGHQRVVRVMPNTPALVGKGMSAWMSTAAVTDNQRAQTQQILSTLGAEHQFADEDHLDMATAISGGGPAYVFLFMESMVEAAVQMGYSRPVAEKFVYQTLDGSIALAQHEATHLAVLRNRVTSPGGTTIEAVYQLEKQGFRAAITDALMAAYKKAQYLGSLDNNE